MSYYIKDSTIICNDIKYMKIITTIVSKAILVFLNFFGRNQLSKIGIAKNSPINILKPKSSFPEIISAAVAPIHSKRKNAFSRLNNIFNTIKEYLINMVFTSYMEEI